LLLSSSLVFPPLSYREASAGRAWRKNIAHLHYASDIVRYFVDVTRAKWNRYYGSVFWY